MGINFSLVLVLSVFLTGIVWLLEIFVLRPRRTSASEKEESQKQPLIVEYSISFFPVLLVVLVLRSFLFEPFQIPSGSMIPTLEIGDFILVNKYAYGVRLPVIGSKIIEVDKPKNGDVMVFVPPHRPDYFIKRVVGIPGDHIVYSNKTLFVNGEEVKLDFVAKLPPSGPQYMVFKESLGEVEHLIHRDLYRNADYREWTVPQGHYFMMGDNRDKSADSRSWGFVPEENIVGKAVAVWMNWKPGLKLPGFSRMRLIN